MVSLGANRYNKPLKHNILGREAKMQETATAACLETSEISTEMNAEMHTGVVAPLDFTVMIKGKPLTTLPADLYIPPDALEVFLEAFQGPMDLLLYLIRKHNLDILDIPIAEVTRQYMHFIGIMKEMKLELAAEYLVMAALLAEIKSRMLLPRQVTEEGVEEDPRAELIRKLQEYEQFKQAAEDLDKLPRLERDWFPAYVTTGDEAKIVVLPDVKFDELLNALKEVMQRAELVTSHQIQREPLSVSDRMTEVLARVRQADFVDFLMLFPRNEGRMGVVVTLLALLELAKEGVIEIVQTENYSPIHVRAIN